MVQQPLPMALPQVLTAVIEPAFEWLPARMDSLIARVMMLTIGQQESGFRFRTQMGNGPAKGFWQNERGGGVKGSMTHPASKPHLQRLCEEHHVTFEAGAIWRQLELDDVFACAQSRLLLWTDPMAMPAIHDEYACWGLYLRVWRPGKPKRDTWTGYHARSLIALGVA